MFETVEQADNAQAPASAAASAAPAAAQAAISEPNAEGLLGGDSGAELGDQPTEPEDTDFEYEGKKFKVPKDIEPELKNALLRHGDYTRKTQEVSEQRRALEAERTMHQQLVQTHSALTKEVSQIVAVDERIQQLSQIDWNTLIAQNPQQAQVLQSEFTRLQTYRGQLGNSITQKQQQLQFAQQQEIAKRTNDAQAFLMREIKDWSPEKGRAFAEYARSKGVDPAHLEQFLTYHPAIALVLNDALQFNQSAKQRATAAKNANPPPKPVGRVTGAAASNTKPLSELSPEEWARAREERRSKRR